MIRVRQFCRLAAPALGASILCAAQPAVADGFAAAASPPRFELTAKPGGVVRDVVEIDNATLTPATYSIKTADWTLDANFGAVFTDALAPGSCRPWVGLERHEITVPSRGKYRFRFEVSPPADAPARGECRFGILVEGAPTTVKTKSGLGVPVSGRLGIIVYVELGDARPDLRILGGAVAKVNGEPTAVIQVKNAGDAHGRLAGFLSGTDAQGAKLSFAPSTLPILPGDTRFIPLVVDQPEKSPIIHIAFPITIHGKIQWASGSTPFSQRFAP